MWLTTTTPMAGHSLQYTRLVFTKSSGNTCHLLIQLFRCSVVDAATALSCTLQCSPLHYIGAYMRMIKISGIIWQKLDLQI